MKWYIKTFFFLFLFFISCLTIGWIVVQQKKTSVGPTQISGSIWDLANRALPGVPVMLYPGKEKKEDCLYTSISNKAGKFYIPKAHPGIYHFATIIDKEMLLLQPFHILEGTSALEIKLVYSGATDDPKRLAQETPPKIKPNPPEPKIKESPPLQKEIETGQNTKGTLEGQVFLDKSPLQTGSFSLIAQHLENPQYKPEFTLSIEKGFYKVHLFPGPYRLTGNLQGSISQPLEIFMLANQITKMDIYFEKEIPQKKGGTDISITVIDSSWTPQFKAQVLLIRDEGNYQKEGETDESGEKIFNSVPAGDYQIKAIFNGLRGRCELEERISIAEGGKLISIVLRETE